MPWIQVEPVLLDCPPGDLCQKKYRGHLRGCPNYGKRPTCPPQAKIWTPDFCLGKNWYAIWNVFDFAGHVAKMREKHPDWSQRQLGCCLYWQGTARKYLRAQIVAFFLDTGFRVQPVEYVPEAHGVDVTETMKRRGIELEWPPKTVTYQIAMIGMSAE